MIFDTIYSVLPVIALLFVAFVLLLKKRNRWNWMIWAILASYYVSYITLQEITGTNSPAIQSLFLAVSVGTASALCALRTKTAWPLLISTIMLVSGMMDFVHYSVTSTGEIPSWNRAYQDAGAIAYYVMLCIVLAHPTIKPVELRHIKSWRYA